MSISGLGSTGFANPLAALIPSVSQDVTATQKRMSPAEAAAAKVLAARSKQEAVLNEIKEKGIYAWAQEQKLEKIEAKARQLILEKRGLTEDDLAKMPEDERAATELSIQEAIAQLVKEALQKNMSNKSAANADGQTPTGPMIIDISV
jgi:hypothetical protein